jgi:cell division protein FtsL
MDAFEYAIKKDIRNNAIVREIDQARQRELWRWASTLAFVGLLLLCTAWQHFELLRHGYDVERLEKERREEQEVNRALQLQVQVLRAPQRIAHIAQAELHMIEPAPADAIVIERAVPADPPARSMVARR